jgi:hypothetical protein
MIPKHPRKLDITFHTHFGWEVFLQNSNFSHIYF